MLTACCSCARIRCGGGSKAGSMRVRFVGEDGVMKGRCDSGARQERDGQVGVCVDATDLDSTAAAC